MSRLTQPRLPGVAFLFFCKLFYSPCHRGDLKPIPLRTFLNPLTIPFPPQSVIFALCSQQVVDFVHAGLEEGKSPTEVASSLLNSCLASDPRETRGIGCDNMTCCIVLFEGTIVSGAEASGSGSGGGEAAPLEPN